VKLDRNAAALDALAAAEILPERQGIERTLRLSLAQRQLYRWIVRQFAAATPPAGDATHTAAHMLGLSAADAVGYTNSVGWAVSHG
jgi:hypothetical protein